MNRRKKEADQHKGWNISISGVFIAMVMGIVLISVVAATLIFVQIYRNAMEQSAVTSSSQSCEQVQNTVENYTQDMRIIGIYPESGKYPFRCSSGNNLW